MATKGRRDRDEDLTTAEYDRRTMSWFLLGFGVFVLGISGGMVAIGFVPEGRTRKGGRRSPALGLLLGALMIAGGALGIWNGRRRKRDRDRR
jgi:hypothetical protein